MPRPLPTMQVHTCHDDGACCRTLRFQAHLEGADGIEPVHETAEACSNHVCEMVHSLARPARGHHLTGAQLRVFAIDRLIGGTPPADPTNRHGPDTLSLAVTTIQLTE
jgi:hypothetical protein